MAGVFAATGQTCMAGSRLIVHESVQRPLIDLLVERANAIKLGYPNDPETEMGPMANEPQYLKVLGYLATASAEGGFFVRPTVITSVDPSRTVVDAAVGGLGLQDLAALFAEMYERCRGKLPDENPARGFEDRGMRLETTFQGAGDNGGSDGRLRGGGGRGAGCAGRPGGGGDTPDQGPSGTRVVSGKPCGGLRAGIHGREHDLVAAVAVFHAQVGIGRVPGGGAPPRRVQGRRERVSDK